MSYEILITCDRCGAIVKGMIEGTFTGGFYRKFPQDIALGGWAGLFNEGERDVCDACMHEDARYKEMYVYDR